MRKITILSVVVSSLLFIACSSEQKHEDGEKSTKEIYQDYKKNKSETKSKVQYPKTASNDKVVEKKDESKESSHEDKKEESPKKVSSQTTEVKQKLTHGDEKTTVTDIIKKAAGDSALATAVTPASKKSKKESSSNGDAFDYKLKPKKVAENVWCFFGALDKPTKENAGFMANGCYIKTKDGYLVMDSGPSYQFAKQAYEAMSKIEKLPVKYVVNSHHHDDHWLGNNFYKEKFKAELRGPESINKNYKEGDQTRMFKILPKNAIKGTHIIDLDNVVKKRQTLEFGGEKFEIIPMDVKAHTQDDVFIYMPERKVLFAGDLVMNGRITSNRDGSVLGQIKALEMMKELDWNVLVPGHGFITDKTAMDESDLYFKLLKERVMKAIEDDVDGTEINEVVKLKEFKDKKMYDILNAHNVGFAFEELEMAE
jgi:glyoxylase-like metal-dependent hydrolase (beta-lactamase superfamily II)